MFPIWNDAFLPRPLQITLTLSNKYLVSFGGREEGLFHQRNQPPWNGGGQFKAQHQQTIVLLTDGQYITYVGIGENLWHPSCYQ
jgi:hypothetical protein